VAAGLFWGKRAESMSGTAVSPVSLQVQKQKRWAGSLENEDSRHSPGPGQLWIPEDTHTVTKRGLESEPQTGLPPLQT